MAKHVFEVAAHVLAAPEAVFRELSCAKNYGSLFSAVQGLSPEAAGGFGGRACTLFLREEIRLRVLHSLAPEHLTIQLTDEYNVITYNFHCTSAAPGTALICRVECCTCSAEGGAWPSEKLARIMQRQDGAIAERLKSYVERTGSVGGCTVSVC